MATSLLAASNGRTKRYSDLVLALGVVAIILLLVLPLTDLALDLLITVSIVLSVTTLLVTLYSEEALSFNSFPTFLLCLTLFRLGLNIAATRMILTEAHAGYIIQTFGNVVTGGNPFVGFVIFVLLSGINFIVITKGSGRVAEVAARFTLDSLPGKQLSIDADVNAGLIDEATAKQRREKIMTEADFYGAMDGASKFVRGDAIAGVVIILVNIIGGFVVGMVMRGMTWEQVVNVYITLTVGEGLVTQIPALLVSVAAGIIVTRSSAKQNLAEAFKTQLFNNPKVLAITGSILLALGLVPGMPLLVLLPISLVLFAYSYYLASGLQRNQANSSSEKTANYPARRSDMENVLFVDTMELELGRSLTPFVDSRIGGNLLKRIALIREQMASELGIIVPSIRIHDNNTLPKESYTIKIKGNQIASGSLQLNRYLAMDPGNVKEYIAGDETQEPAFGLKALWITPDKRESAIKNGYIVADPLTVLATHLIEVIRNHAAELLNRQEVAKLVQKAREISPAVVDELIPLKLNLGQILRVLQNLLKEGVSIRDFVTILEILADQSSKTTDPDVLSEYVRLGLARTISRQFLSSDKALHAITLDPKVQQIFQESLKNTDFGKIIVVHPSTHEKIIEEINNYIADAAEKSVQPVLVTTGSLRSSLRRLIERQFPRLPVLSINEISQDVPLVNLGVVSMEVLMV